MKRFNSVLCASLLTLAISSAALAGNISGRTATTPSAPGNISGAPGNISGAPGNISGLTGEIYSAILGLLIP